MRERHLADLWELVAECRGSEPALIHGGTRRIWSEFDARASSVSSWLLEAGLGHQAKVAQYLPNRPEYLETVAAALKASLVPVNTNYRYTAGELAYLWDNADVEAVVFAGRYATTIEPIRALVPGVSSWLWVQDGDEECPDWATPYEHAAAGPATRAPAWNRSPDDLWLLYTGGTTGMPRGAMWRLGDLFAVANRTAKLRVPEDADDDDVRHLLMSGPGPVHIPACPLMHGTGSITSFQALSSGGCVVTLTADRFDAVELLDTVEQERATSVVIVGDVFTRPMLEVLRDDPTARDLTSVRVLSSSGATWTPALRDELGSYFPRALLVDTLGSSEAVGTASTVINQTEATPDPLATPAFTTGPDTRVLADDGTWVVPGSGINGLIARRAAGRTAIGYYNDDESTAGLFRMVDGERWMLTGDWAELSADGAITLLGRGSTCINTGGEKVFPEEVEEALKSHPCVRDAAVVGLPDDRLGETVAAIVVVDADTPFADDDLKSHVRRRLAGYKAPRLVLTVDDLDRAPNGKLDRPRWKTYAARRS